MIHPLLTIGKRNVNVSVDIADRMMKDIESKLSQSIDSSGITKAVDVANERAEKILNAGNEIRLTADTTRFDSAIDGSKHKIDALNNSVQNMAVPPGFWTEFATESDKRAYAQGTIGIGALVDLGAINPRAIDPNMIPESQRGFYDYMMTPATNYTPMPEMYATEEERLAAEKVSSYVSANNYGYDQEAIKYIENYANPSNPPELSIPQIESTGMEQGADVTDTYLNSIGEGMKSVTSKVASQFMGARMLYKGINEAASDFQAAFEADNNYDSQRSLARGATKAGLMGTGAVIGSLVGMPMLGAGAGALVSDLFGDDLADILSGMHKSADEIKQDRLDELFGDIAMSASDLEAATNNMLGSFQTRISEIHQQSFSTGYSMRDNVFSEYGGIWELGSKLQLKNNLLLKNTDADLKAFQTQVSSYMDDITDTIAQEMYNAFMNNDDLFGYGNWNTSALSQKYSNLFKDVTEQADELSKYLINAMVDGQLTTDEVDHINGVIHTTQGKVDRELPDEGQINTDTYSFLAQNGILSKGSYDELVEGLTTDYSNNILNLANERSLAIANGMDVSKADEAFWGKANAQTESSMQFILNTAQSKYGEDYNSAMSSLWRGEDGTGLHSFYEEGTQYDRYLSSARNSLDYYQAHGDPSYLRGAKGQLSGIKDLITGSFSNVDIGEQGSMNEAYNGMQPMLQLVEGQAKAVKAAGGDISPYIDELMEMYQTGAMGGGAIAKDKYAAMLMSSKQEYVDLMNDVFGGNSELMSQFMGENFTDMWELLNGSNKEGTEKVADQLNEAGEKLKEAEENVAQKASDAAGDAASAATETVEDNTNTAAETIKDKTEDMFNDITDATQQSGEQANEAAKSAAEGLGENILNAIGESLDNIDADMLGESGIGEKLMNSIAESLSADNMDFGELSIGQSILEGISSSFEGVEFGELDIDGKIMNAISASLEGVDFSGITEGITSQFQELGELQCDIKLNAQDNITDMATAADTAVREIPETWETTLSDVDNASAIANSVAEAVNAIPTSVNVSITATTSGFPAGFHFASGTPNAPEGMAWLNDDGTADPRELIEHNGQFMMYEGRDVLAPLSKGDRVFTSAQTKDILSGKGIPHFAEGVNNEVIATNREVIGSGFGGASVSIDGLNININIDGNSNGNIVDEIRQRSGEIAEIVTSEIERHLSASFANSTGGD